MNPALAIFGLLCVAVSILVLVGERDWAWLADSFLGPAILCGLGGVVLAATLWPGDRPTDPPPQPWTTGSGRRRRHARRGRRGTSGTRTTARPTGGEHRRSALRRSPTLAAVSSPVMVGPGGLPEGSPERARIQRHTLRVLMAGQILGSSSLGAALVVGSFIVKDILGSGRLGGIATAGFTLGSALASIPLSRLMMRRGRRVGLQLGYLLAALRRGGGHRRAPSAASWPSS